MSRRKHAWAAYHDGSNRSPESRSPEAVEMAVIADFLDAVDGRLVEIAAIAQASHAANVLCGIELAGREMRAVADAWMGT